MVNHSIPIDIPIYIPITPYFNPCSAVFFVWSPFNFSDGFRCSVFGNSARISNLRAVAEDASARLHLGPCAMDFDRSIWWIHGGSGGKKRWVFQRR